MTCSRGYLSGLVAGQAAATLLKLDAKIKKNWSPLSFLEPSETSMGKYVVTYKPDSFKKIGNYSTLSSIHFALILTCALAPMRININTLNFSSADERR
ncbi:hypothetical protein BJV77DRAFT_634333 [Russula vinacea]|nr:hypothetical protein BJV77DRAFT_634333 [Russula vinacea]